MLANQLVSLHIVDSPYKQLPSYDYDHLQKGITCAKCNSLSITSRLEIIVFVRNVEIRRKLSITIMRSVRGV